MNKQTGRRKSFGIVATVPHRRLSAVQPATKLQRSVDVSPAAVHAHHAR